MNKSDKDLARYLKYKIDAILREDFQRQARICKEMYSPVRGLIHITVLIPDMMLSAISKKVAREVERLYGLLEDKKVRFDIFEAGNERSFCAWFCKKEDLAPDFGVRIFGQRRTDKLIAKLKKEVDFKLKDGDFSHSIQLPVSEHNITPMQMENLAELFRGKWKFVKAEITLTDFGDAYPKLYLGNMNGMHYFLFS